MSMGKWLLFAAVGLGSTSIILAADDTKMAAPDAKTATPATQPADAKVARGKRLIEPWSLMKSLTPEQTAQIEKIHADTLEQRKKIEAKEHDDVMALLNPDQATEAKSIEEKLKTDRKKTAAERRKATTEPAK